MIFQVSLSAVFMWFITNVSHYPDILQLQGQLHIYVECAQHAVSSSSSSSALQPWVGLDLLKQMSPATSILGNRPPISTTQFPCVFLYPINPSYDFDQPRPLWPPGFVHDIHLGNSFLSIHTTWPAHLSLLDFIMLTVFGSL